MNINFQVQRNERRGGGEGSFLLDPSGKFYWSKKPGKKWMSAAESWKTRLRRKVESGVTIGEEDG